MIWDEDNAPADVSSDMSLKQRGLGYLSRIFFMAEFFEKGQKLECVVEHTQTGL